MSGLSAGTWSSRNATCDGRLDVHTIAEGERRVLRAQPGPRTFAAASPLPGGYGAERSSLGDVTGDGLLDRVYRRRVLRRRAGRPGTGSGAYAAPTADRPRRLHD